MLHWIRYKMSGSKVADADNIYMNTPPPGTILGDANAQEVRRGAELEAKYITLMRLQEMQIKLENMSFKELYNEFYEFETESIKFWTEVARRLGVPYEWPIRIDYANDFIYLGGNDSFEEE